ncbi:acyl-CoA carboxylase subunit beta [Egicoccus halophilus]|uniref:Putative acetyl/propionyl-CoA carboxylase beta subunit AccD2 n=1 Tax=Egicoccus halophilus TaxID=1670830 RepID=A0A8J3A996_9ACTN|nr:carboxyl transferase domain-containing protein [Egicoccus halophilus]GGI05268.1 putative acetyl/propionyl-CoA carboxylase beta subunit AccD2 [Egicoccus halophilus]
MDTEVLDSRVDPTSDTFVRNREGNLATLVDIEHQLALAAAGGGPDKLARHRRRGKLTIRERIGLLLDPGSPFLELQPLIGWGSDALVGGSVVQGIGVVSGTECLVTGTDPTVKGGASNPWSVHKALRGLQVAAENRLPVVNLTESAGADLRHQKDIFVPGGRTFHDLTALSKAGVPTIAVVFGSSTAGGAYVPGLSDHTVLVRERSRVFLGGPPLVRMATGEEADEEELGGAEMHARTSGLADHLADDEYDAIRIARRIVAHLHWRKAGPSPSGPADEPVHDPEELLGIASVDLREPFDSREVLARVVDGSRFAEFKPVYGPNLVCGFASVHGHRIGVLANNGVLFNQEAEKGAQFIQLANRVPVPLLFLQNVTGFMVGTRYEQAGIVKDGAKLINAVTNSEVPHLTVMTGASYGAGNYGMCGRAYDPRLLFTWPNHAIAVMGPQQLAGVLSIVARKAAADRGEPYDDAQDAAVRTMVEQQVAAESHALFATGQGWDDGVIDPRDTRDVLGLALSAVCSAEVRGATGFGVFRM